MAQPTTAPHTPAPPISTAGSPELVPLAVWSCAQTSAQYQRLGRYLPASSTHPGKMLPELARRLVAEYCPPGGLIADPMCGIGTTLVEAAALGRRAVGVELEPRWAGLARANLAAGSCSPGPLSSSTNLPWLGSWLDDLTGRPRTCNVWSNF
jgi:DNA methylase